MQNADYSIILMIASLANSGLNFEKDRPILSDNYSCIGGHFHPRERLFMMAASHNVMAAIRCIILKLVEHISWKPDKYLLQGSDGSSTCLICHSVFHDRQLCGGYISTSAPGSRPAQLTPGGDFAYIQKNYSWITSKGVMQNSPGDRHGHNIIATDYNYFQDATYNTSPGGYYPSANLSCISCHDPHGRFRITSSGMSRAEPGGRRYHPLPRPALTGCCLQQTTAVGVYRLLGGKNYQPTSLSGNYAFVYDPFYAVSPSNYNRSEATSRIRGSHMGKA